MDSSFSYNLLFKASESCSISLCSSHCTVVTQWNKSSTCNVIVESCLYRDFFATSLEQKWDWSQDNVSKVVEVVLALLIYLASQQYQ